MMVHAKEDLGSTGEKVGNSVIRTSDCLVW